MKNNIYLAAFEWNTHKTDSDEVYRVKSQMRLKLNAKLYGDV